MRMDTVNVTRDVGLLCSMHGLAFLVEVKTWLTETAALGQCWVTDTE